MSTAYYVFCRTCNVSETADDFHTPIAPQERINNAVLIVAFDKAFPSQEVEIRHANFHLDLSFYHEHWNHDLVVKDEYRRYHEAAIPSFNVVEIGDCLDGCLYKPGHGGPCNTFSSPGSETRFHKCAKCQHERRYHFQRDQYPTSCSLICGCTKFEEPR
jgi:hypothetical protein